MRDFLFLYAPPPFSLPRNFRSCNYRLDYRLAGFCGHDFYSYKWTGDTWFPKWQKKWGRSWDLRGQQFYEFYRILHELNVREYILVFSSEQYGWTLSICLAYQCSTRPQKHIYRDCGYLSRDFRPSHAVFKRRWRRCKKVAQYYRMDYGWHHRHASRLCLCRHPL